MANFTITGFADEISANFDEQIEGLKKLGIGYIEPRGIDGKNISALTEEEAKAVKAKLDAAGIKVSSIGSPIGKIGINDDFEAHKKLLLNVIKVAKILDTKYIRVFSFFVPEGKAADYKEKVLSQFKEMVDIAEENGVILLHENEKDIYGDIADRCMDIVNYIDSPAFGVVFDPANFVQCGEDTKRAFELLKNHITYMHIKDSRKDCTVVPAGYGEGNVPYILNSLKEMGYEGFTSLEPHLGSFEGLAELENSDLVKKLPKSGFDTFEIAYNALCKIIK